MARKVASPQPRTGATAVASLPSPDLDEVVSGIGRKLRDLRQAQGLSLQQLAAQARVSAAAIHKVERGDMVPTITTLLKLAAALRRPVSYFVDEPGEPAEVAWHVPAGQGRPVDTRVRGLALEDVSGPPSRFRLRAEVATIAPGATSGPPRPDGAGEWLLVVLAGSVLVQVQGRDHRLGPGDTLHFPSDRASGWVNEAAEPARVLWVRLADR